jgi:uncharacterized protein (TIGR03435 family)
MSARLFLALALVAAARAQDPSFEAASVKVHESTGVRNERSGIDEAKGMVRIDNMSLRSLIQMAYGIRDFQLVGPGWLSSTSFDIAAKPSGEYKHEQLQPLMRSLLAERFKLTVHHESKQVQAYSLVTLKGGPKLAEASRPRSYFTARPGLIECTEATIPQIAGALARLLDRPVADGTGLTAKYEIKLEWTPDDAQTSEPGPSLFSALQDVAGLKLQTTKVTVDVVAVDHVERLPTAN